MRALVTEARHRVHLSNKLVVLHLAVGLGPEAPYLCHTLPMSILLPPRHLRE